jgi:Flp pilus assembly protein TadG
MPSRSTSLIRRARRGNAAVGFAVVGLFLGGLGGLALDLNQVVSQRAALQSIVDSAALAGAKELAVASVPDTAIEGRALDHAIAGAAQDPVTRRAEFGANVHDRRDAVTVTGQVLVPSIMPGGGGTVVAVEATAENLQKTPLCILMTERHWGPKVELRNNAALAAPGCLIQVNGSLNVQSTSSLVAEAIRVSGTSTGAAIPVPQTGAVKVPDPFATALQRPDISADCAGRPARILTLSGSLAPGVHCDAIIVAPGQSLRLLPGDHLFNDIIRLDGTARLDGTDVALVFPNAYYQEPIRASNEATINLEGRRDGPYAGMVLYFANDNRKGINLTATGVRNLTGVVYMPTGIITLDARGDVAEASDWTVIVAEQLILTGQARLVVNKNYAGSAVPVPQGVGPDGTLRLRR